MWEFDALLREKGSWFALSCYSSFYIVILWSHVSYDWTTRPTRLLWPFSSDMPLYNTGTIAALLFLSFLSLLLMWDQSVFVHAGWQLSSMFTTPEGEASLSQNRWGGLVCPLSLSLAFSLCLSPHSLFQHFGWAGAVEQAYGVAKSLCICWGDSLFFIGNWNNYIFRFFAVSKKIESLAYLNKTLISRDCDNRGFTSQPHYLLSFSTSVMWCEIMKVIFIRWNQKLCVSMWKQLYPMSLKTFCSPHASIP